MQEEILRTPPKEVEKLTSMLNTITLEGRGGAGTSIPSQTSDSSKTTGVKRAHQITPDHKIIRVPDTPPPPIKRRRQQKQELGDDEASQQTEFRPVVVRPWPLG